MASVCESVIGACYLHHGFEETGAGGRRRVLRAGRPRLRDRARLQVRASGAPRTRRRPGALRGDRGGGAAARALLRGCRRASMARSSARARGARRRRLSRRPPPRRSITSERLSRHSVRGPRSSLVTLKRPAYAPAIDLNQGVQVVPRSHEPGVRSGRERDRRAERLRQVERHRRGPLGAGRAEPALGARPVDAGHGLYGRRGRRAQPLRRGRGRPRDRRGR